MFRNLFTAVAVTRDKVIVFLFSLFLTVNMHAADYTKVTEQSKAAVVAGGEMISPWIVALIAWAPFIAIMIAIIGVYAYERNKSKEERKDGTFKIIIILIIVAILIMLMLELVISLVMDYLTGNPELGTTIRQTYWNTVIK